MLDFHCRLTGRLSISPFTHAQSGKDAFAILQSAWAGLQRSSSPSTKVVVGQDCTIARSYSSTSRFQTPGKRAFEAAYNAAGYAANNGLRMAFYLQMPLLVARSPAGYNGVQLTGGWPIFTLVYQAIRQLYRWSSDDTLWGQNRDLLGMGLFSRTGGAGKPYAANQNVGNIIGNDFLLIQLSFITAKDWRPYWDLRGVPYSRLANQQVAAHVASGRVAATTRADFPFMALDIKMPQANMTAEAVPIDGTSAWPDDGFTVQSCSVRR
jgi:immunomodulating metalloprotease